MYDEDYSPNSLNAPSTALNEEIAKKYYEKGYRYGHDKGYFEGLEKAIYHLSRTLEILNVESDCYYGRMNSHLVPDK